MYDKTSIAETNVIFYRRNNQRGDVIKDGTSPPGTASRVINFAG